MVLASELAQGLGLALAGEDRDLTGVNTLEAAGPSDLSFLANPKYAPQLAATRAGCVLVGGPDQAQGLASALVSANVYQDLAKILHLFAKPQGDMTGVSPLAFVHESAELGENVTVMPLAFVGPRTKIGPGTRIFPHCYLGEDCTLGRDCLLYPGVTLMAGTILGDRVSIQPGTVIGGDGFGYVPTPAGHVKIPQIGRTIIESDVEIGANTCIDRAALDLTQVGQGTKIDNLVHLAHNVRIGRNCLLAGQSGLAGSTRIGDNCILAGQVGLADNLTIGDNVVLGAQSGVNHSLPDNYRGAGSPVLAQGDYLRASVGVSRLPQIMKQLSRLEKDVEELKTTLARNMNHE